MKYFFLIIFLFGTQVSAEEPILTTGPTFPQNAVENVADVGAIINQLIRNPLPAKSYRIYLLSSALSGLSAAIISFSLTQSNASPWAWPQFLSLVGATCLNLAAYRSEYIRNILIPFHMVSQGAVLVMMLYSSNLGFNSAPLPSIQQPMSPLDGWKNQTWFCRLGENDKIVAIP
jgi:hypothetical protein